MGIVKVDITVSLDGFVAGPNQSLEEPLGEHGEQLHDWLVSTKSFADIHGHEGGGETGIDDEIGAEHLAGVGATIMGRGMYSTGSGPWEDDPKANGWWGDEPPFHHPVFVLTHHEREPLELTGTTFHFVTSGIESALEQARAAAGDGDVAIAGGGSVVSQYLKAGAVDDLGVHIAPMLLGEGARLFEDHIAQRPGKLELTRAIQSPTGVMHLKYTPEGR
jgi:dihydrofolate reductase